jgi:hypothetical protein
LEKEPGWGVDIGPDREHTGAYRDRMTDLFIEKLVWGRVGALNRRED